MRILHWNPEWCQWSALYSRPQQGRNGHANDGTALDKKEIVNFDYYFVININREYIVSVHGFIDFK